MVKHNERQYAIRTCNSGRQIIQHSKLSLVNMEKISHSIKYVPQAPSCPWVYSGLDGGMCQLYHNPPLDFLLDSFFNRHWLGQV
jgi:hypothetical protein